MAEPSVPAPVAPLVRVKFQDSEQDRKGRLLLRFDKSRDEFARRRGQHKTGQQRRDLLADDDALVWAAHAVTPSRRAS